MNTPDNFLPAQKAPLRSLVVDDDGDDLQTTAKMLARSGYEVDAAEDGAVAWETLQLLRYDLLITDYNLPKVTGVELAKKVRAARKALPVILASGAIPAAELDQHPWLEVAATLAKPSSADQLLVTVKAALVVTDAARPPEAPPPS